MDSRPPQRPEVQLVDAVRRLKRGEKGESDVRLLDDRLRPTLLAYFRNHSFRSADAEDLTQETLMKATAAIGSLRDEARFFGWLFQIARNVRLRAAAPSVQPQEDLEGGAAARLPNHDPSPLDAAMSHERLEHVWSAIERLPPQQRQCLLLRVVRDLGYDEIAALMRLNPLTVRNHLREARSNLRRELERIGGAVDGRGRT